jgi:hypothetical protein
MPDHTPTTHDENASTWRDLADQLTPKQIAKLEDSERRYRGAALLPKPWWSTAPRSESEIACTLVKFARMYARESLNDVLFAEIASGLAACPPCPGSRMAGVASTAHRGASSAPAV